MSRKAHLAAAVAFLTACSQGATSLDSPDGQADESADAGAPEIVVPDGGNSKDAIGPSDAWGGGADEIVNGHDAMQSPDAVEDGGGSAADASNAVEAQASEDANADAAGGKTTNDLLRQYGVQAIVMNGFDGSGNLQFLVAALSDPSLRPRLPGPRCRALAAGL